MSYRNYRKVAGMTVTMSRDAILEALQRNLSAAKREDARRKAAHERDEESALAKFRSVIKAAMFWDYKRVKAKGFEVGIERGDCPQCPQAEAPDIELMVRSVKADTKRDEFSVIPESLLHKAVFWQPEAQRSKRSLCDE